jgi:hypothetical protein
VFPADNPITALVIVFVGVEVLGFKLKFNPDRFGALVSNAVRKSSMDSLYAQTVFFTRLDGKTKKQRPARCLARNPKVLHREAEMDDVQVNCVSFSYLLSDRATR